VVEWETVLEGKLARGVACLASLRAQVAELPGCETVVMFDPAEASEEAVRALIGGEWPGTLRVAAAPRRLDYYQKKNHGFTLTTGDVVVFVDSDLIPEPDWLKNLVGSFADFRVSLVTGRTHLETATLYERAVALFWIFDTRDPSSGLRPTRRLVSNNVAVRRALFTQFPFPDRPTFRGQCGALGAILETHRISMYEQPAARASHPAPDGARRFFARAWHAGRDSAYYDALDGRGTLAQALRTWGVDLGHVRERIHHRAPLIAARRADVAAAFVLGFAFYAIKLTGAMTAVAGRGLRSALTAPPRPSASSHAAGRGVSSDR
jgi:glycosyltransferase involved in cell wall biosynthesis